MYLADSFCQNTPHSGWTLNNAVHTIYLGMSWDSLLPQMIKLQEAECLQTYCKMRQFSSKLNKYPSKHLDFCFLFLFLSEFFLGLNFFEFLTNFICLFCDSFAICRSIEICGLWEHSPNFVSRAETVLCCNERDSLRCRKGLTHSPLSFFYLYLSEVCFNLFLCGSEKFKNYEEFCDTDMTSEKLDQVTGKNV